MADILQRYFSWVFREGPPVLRQVRDTFSNTPMGDSPWLERKGFLHRYFRYDALRDAGQAHRDAPPRRKGLPCTFLPPNPKDPSKQALFQSNAVHFEGPFGRSGTSPVLTNLSDGMSHFFRSVSNEFVSGKGRANGRPAICSERETRLIEQEEKPLELERN